MLTEIEDTAAAYLAAQIATPARVAIQEAHKALSLPEIDVFCDPGTFEKVAQAWKLKVSLYVIITFQNLRNVKERRAGAYPIIEAVLGWLIGRKLGLTIDGLKPVRASNITDEKEANAGRFVVQLEFETGYMVPILSDEQLDDLYTIGLNYYLKPGDETADAVDVVTVQEPPAP